MTVVWSIDAQTSEWGPDSVYTEQAKYDVYIYEVYDDFIVINLETDSYPNGASCVVSLDVENKDSYTNVSVGNEVVVYYNGKIAESYPLQINTVYAITLKTPANQETE